MRRVHGVPERPLWERFLDPDRGEELAPILEDRGTHIIATFPLPAWVARRDIDVTVHDGMLLVTVDGHRQARGRDLRAHGALHIGTVPPDDLLVERTHEELRVLVPSLAPDPVHVPVIDRERDVLLHA